MTVVDAPELASTLRQKGETRAMSFTWRRAAESLLAAVDHVE
jgi:hypothetical protein